MYNTDIFHLIINYFTFPSYLQFAKFDFCEKKKQKQTSFTI